MILGLAATALILFLFCFFNLSTRTRFLQQEEVDVPQAQLFQKIMKKETTMTTTLLCRENNNVNVLRQKEIIDIRTFVNNRYP